jgi:hypothetical protein
MIIKLLESKLFTVDPALRFAREYNVKPELWNEIWKRHALLEYDLDGICGYFNYKTHRRPKKESIARWILRTELYCRAQHIIRMGQRVVDSEYFGVFEAQLIQELTRNMRFSAIHDSRTIV